MRIISAALAALLSSSLPSEASCPASWSAGPAGPSARWGAAMAHHAASGRTVLHGGADARGRFLGDTWLWDGSGWTRLDGDGPEPRQGAAAAYDAGRGVVVLFGGSDTSLAEGNRLFSETWEWDGAAWSRRALPGPPGRVFHAMAYDAARRRVVLFGGDRDHSARLDTWEYDGTAWTERAAGPDVGFSPSMAYDPVRQRVVLSGGAALTGETWEWDGVAWVRRDLTPRPAPRYQAALAWDAAREALVLVGGNGNDGPVDGPVWELDGSGWRSLETGGLPSRGGHAAAYDTRRERLVVFGGVLADRSIAADTWMRRVPVDVPRLVPIALDVASGTARYTTELALTNRGDRETVVSLRYTASLGAGSGTVAETLPAGRQRTIPDVLAYLRDHGLAIPPSTGTDPQAGTLLVSFGCASSAGAVSVTARTTTPTAAPLPEGSAGLAYGAERTAGSGTLVVHGLRVNGQDRSNVAVFATSEVPLAVRLTAVAGDGSGTRVVLDDSRPLGPYEWAQYSLGPTGLASARVVVERVAGGGSFGAYGVVNDNVTNDGSFVAAVPPSSGVPAWIVPALVETTRFRSELVLGNAGDGPVTLRLAYGESLAAPSAGTVPVTLTAGEQRIIPSAIDFLRRGGVPLGSEGDASRAGALRVTVDSGSPAGVFAAARTAAAAPGGGQFGLFTPAVPADGDPLDEATVDGLRADATARSNVAVVNTGGSGSVTLSLQVFDGADGEPRGDAVTRTLEPGAWAQLDGILAAAGASTGWVRVRRVSGTAPWLAYGVVNDGGSPGERTGDGAYVPMEAGALR